MEPSPERASAPGLTELVPVSSPRSVSLLERDLARIGKLDLPSIVRTDGVDTAAHAYRRAATAGLTLPLDWARGQPRAAIIAFGLEALATLGRLHDLGLVAGGVRLDSFRMNGDRPVLVDLARLGEEGERAEPEASRAPEALAGSAIDRRTDIHGAGLLVRALLEASGPRGLEPGSPLELALATLAAPARTDRPSSAGLARALLASAAGLRLDEIPHPALTPAGVRFTGHALRLEEALEAARRALATPPEPTAPGLVLVSAPPGGGRTRFADEVLERLTREGAMVVRVDARRAPGRPFSAFVDAVLLLPRPKSGWPERVRESLARVIPELVAAGASPPIEPDASPELESPEEAHDARIVLLDALASALAHLAAGAPLILAIDDLDRADEGSRLAAGFLARRLAAARRFSSSGTPLVGDEGSNEAEVAPPILLFATMTAGGTCPPDVLALAREEHVLELGLEPLGEEELAALCGALTGEPPSDPKTRELARLSHGNPGLLGEAVRLGTVPANVAEARRAAAQSLSAEDRRLLLALVALGSQGDPELLAEISGADLTATRDGLARLTARELVRRRPRGYTARPSAADALAEDAKTLAFDVAQALGHRLAASTSSGPSSSPAPSTPTPSNANAAASNAAPSNPPASSSETSTPAPSSAAPAPPETSTPATASSPSPPPSIATLTPNAPPASTPHTGTLTGIARDTLSIRAAEAAAAAGQRELLDRAAPMAIAVLERLRQDGRAAKLALARAESSLARGDKRNGALWLGHAGRAFFRAGERTSAHETLVRATNEGEGLDPELRGSVWRWLGAVRASLGQTETAHAAFRKARAALARSGNASAALERAAVFLADAEASFAQGDLDHASERGEGGLRALRDEAGLGAVPGTARVRARLLGLVGVVALRRGQPGEAETLLRAALALDERHHAESEAARTLQRLGAVALAQGDAKAAVTHWRRSLAIRERTGDRSGVAQLQASLSLAAAREGDLAQGRSLLRRSLRTREELGDRRGRAAALHNLGYILAAQGDSEAAVRALEECLGLREELADPWYLASTRNSLGQVLLDLGRVDEARDHLTVALELRRRHKDRPGEAATLANLCEIAVRAGDFENAIELEAAQRRIRAGLGSPEDAIDGLRRGARLEIALGNMAVAVEASKRAQKLAHQSDLKLQEPPSRLLHGEALARSGRLDRAKRELERARASAEAIGDRLTSRRAEVELAALLVARGFPEDARALLDSVPVPRPGATQGSALARPPRRPDARGPLRVRERLLRARIELARPGGQAALARHFALEALDSARAGVERDLEWRALQAASAAAEREGDENGALELAAAAQEVVEALLNMVPEARRDAWLKADPARPAALRGDTALASLVPAPGLVALGEEERPRVLLRSGAIEDDDAPTRPGIFTLKKKRPGAKQRGRTPIPPRARSDAPLAPTKVKLKPTISRVEDSRAEREVSRPETLTPSGGLPRTRTGSATGDVARADFAAILGLNRRIVDETRTERLFPHLVDSVARLCGAERAFLIFFGEGENDVEVMAARGLQPGEVLAPRESFARNVARRAAESGEPVVTADALRETDVSRTTVVGAGLKSVLAAPVRSPDGRRGALYLDHGYQIGVFGARELKLTEAVADQCALACGRAALERALARARARPSEKIRIEAEAASQDSRLLEDRSRESRSTEARSPDARAPESRSADGRSQEGRAALPRSLESRTPESKTSPEPKSATRPTVEPARFFGIVGHSATLRRAISRLVDAARNEEPILIYGPQGVGKERAARALHLASARSQRPVVVLDVRDARAAKDIESALNGSEELPGGALARVGAGTLVVKAIDTSTPEVQEALARLLAPLLGTRRPGTPRLVATATAEDAIVASLAALFNKSRIYLPSLRERREDVQPLMDEVLTNLTTENGGVGKTLAASAREALAARPLHGQAREIVGTLVAAWARAGKRREIQLEDLPPPHPKPGGRRHVGVD